MICTVSQTAAFCIPFQARQGQGVFVHAVLSLTARSPEAHTTRLPEVQVAGDVNSAFLPGLLLP